MFNRLLFASLGLLPLATPAGASEVRVNMETSLGTIVLALDEEKAPETVRNFVQYVEEGFYDGTVFHRVIDGFMIQGGGHTEDMARKETRDPIQNEADNGLRNVAGSIAMARTSDPHSATAQFFINVADNTFLDHPGQDGWGYAVFGRVIEGQDVVDSIRQVKTGRKGPHSDVPVDSVMIEKVTLIEQP